MVLRDVLPVENRVVGFAQGGQRFGKGRSLDIAQFTSRD